MIEVNVSCRGGAASCSLDPSWTVERVKQELHDQLRDIPIPDKQRLICVTRNFREMNNAQDTIGSLCTAGDDLVVIPRREQPAAPLLPRRTAPAVSMSQINAAIKDELERAAAEGEEPPPPEEPAAGPQQAAATAAAAQDVVDSSIRALVEGNFEQLREYLEQLQEAMARQAVPGDFVMEMDEGDEDEDEEYGEEDDDGEGEDEEDDEEGDEEEEEEEGGEHGGGGGGAAAAASYPDPEEALLLEMTNMGFPEQLSRNALQLHRNRMQHAVDWALNHVDDSAAQQPLSEEVLAAAYGRAPAPRLLRAATAGPDAASLASMVEMGFDRGQATRALVYAGNRLEDACQLLLSGIPLPQLPPGDTGGGGGAAGGVGEDDEDEEIEGEEDSEEEEGTEEEECSEGEGSAEEGAPAGDGGDETLPELHSTDGEEGSSVEEEDCSEDEFESYAGSEALESEADSDGEERTAPVTEVGEGDRVQDPPPAPPSEAAGSLK